MIVQCDSCKAKFQLADERITEKGAKVRCSKCKSVFTVKKQMDQPQDAPDATPPASVSKPAPSGGAKEEDPFSDFNFSDDLDFGEEEEITVQSPAKPPTPEPDSDFGSDFPDDSPSAPDPPGGQAAEKSEKAPSDEGFDFSDEDFSFSDENEDPASAPPPAPSPDPPPAPSPAPPDDFGDFKLDDDGDAAPASDQAPPPPPPSPSTSDEDFGNVSFSDNESDFSTDDEEEGGFGDDADESGFGDFQFDSDDSLPSDGDDDMGMDADDFVRSSTSQAPVTDDLEASIGDSEMETEKRVEQPDPPPPPKPLVQIETQPGSRKWLMNLLIVMVLIVGGIVGVMGYLNSKDWFTFSELRSGDFSRVGKISDKFQIDRGWKEEPETGEVKLVRKPTPQVVVRENGAQIIVVAGSVINNTNKDQSAILVQASLKDETGEVVDTAQSYCNVEFTDEELKTGSTIFIKDMMTIEHGRNQECFQVASGQSRKYTVVFFDLPGGNVTVSKPRVVGYKALGGGEVELVEGSSTLVIDRENGTRIIVVEGLVINNTAKNQSSILVQANLKDETGDVVDIAQSYCDVEFSDEELKTGSKVFIKEMTTNERGRNQECFQVAPGESRIFTLVFFKSTGGDPNVSTPMVVGYKALGEDE